jgi:hypothetical protein
MALLCIPCYRAIDAPTVQDDTLVHVRYANGTAFYLCPGGNLRPLIAYREMQTLLLLPLSLLPHSSRFVRRRTISIPRDHLISDVSHRWYRVYNRH